MDETNGSDESGASNDDAARQHAELEALRDLVRLVAHDLNNPLQSITLILELLELDAADEASRERVRQCAEGAQLMRRLVRDLSDFARGPVGRGQGEMLKDLLERTLGVTRRRLERHRVVVDVQIEALRERRLVSATDAFALRSALLNAILGVIAAASRSEAKRHELLLHAEPDALFIELTPAAGADASSGPIGADYLARVIDACAGSSLTASTRGASLRIEIPVDQN